MSDVTLYTISDLLLSAILVTGGDAAEVSVEVIREDGTLCSLADGPSRTRHSMSGFTMCGGATRYAGSSVYSCSTLTAGEWRTSHNMNDHRIDHLSWNSPNGTLLLGGCLNCDPSYQTTELLSTTSSSSTPAFTLSFDIWYSCGIELVDRVVVTGGYGDAGNIVQVYNMMGPVERLPDMTISRSGHGCAHYIDSNDNIVSIIFIINNKQIDPCIIIYIDLCL